MSDDPALAAVVDRWDDPRYGLRMTRDDLMRAASEGADAEAGIRRMIPTYHEGLVVMLAMERRGRGLDLADLKQEGNLGLIRAAAKFDPGYRVKGKPVEFGQYAGRWVKEFMYSAINENSPIIRLPRYVHAQLNQVRRGDATIAEFKPSQREILLQACEASRRVARHNSRGGWSWADVLPDTRAGRDEVDGFADLLRMVDGLGRHERIAITLRFGLDGLGERTFAAIGAELGVDNTSASQLVARATASLRRAAERRGVGFADLMSA